MDTATAKATNNFRSKLALVNFVRVSLTAAIDATLSVRQNPIDAAERLCKATFYVTFGSAEVSWTEVNDYLKSLKLTLHHQPVSIFLRRTEV